MKEYGKFFLKFLIFLVTAVAVYAGSLLALTHMKVGGNKLIYRAVQGLVWKGGFTYDRFREFKENRKYDILAFGSSRANRGFDPVSFEKAGYSFYNLGTDDQTPLNTCVLIKQFVRKENCRLVIIDLYDKVFAQNALESNSDLIQNLDNDFYAFKMAVAAKDVRAINQFGVRMCLKSSPPEYNAEAKLYNGFRALDEPFHYSDDHHLYETIPSHLRAFDETLNYLHKNNIAVLLTCQPLPLRPYHHSRFLADIKPIVEKYHYEIYDYTEAVNIVDPAGFSDMSHLNKFGARRYSDFLVNKLIRKVISPLAAANVSE